MPIGVFAKPFSNVRLGVDQVFLCSDHDLLTCSFVGGNPSGHSGDFILEWVIMRTRRLQRKVEFNWVQARRSPARNVLKAIRT